MRAMNLRVMHMNFIERLLAAELVDVQSATSVAAFAPFTALPKRYQGKRVALVELDDAEAKTLARVQAGEESPPKIA